MDLVAKGPDGHLDPYAACMLLWSDAVSIATSEVTWDGRNHHAPNPVVNKGVISMYGVSPEEVRAVLPDFLSLLATLEADECLRVPLTKVAVPIRDVLPAGDLSGATLFLLQAGAHSLHIEPVDRSTSRIRYDALLAHGIPHLQTLLCRMLCHLRCLAGEHGTFAIEFVRSSRPRGSSDIREFKEIVPGGRAQLEARVEVEDPLLEFGFTDRLQQQDTSADASPAQPADVRSIREACALESRLYTTRRLYHTLELRLEGLEATEGELDSQRPDPNSELYRKPSSSSLRKIGGVRAARSLAIRSAVYLTIGMAFLFVGRLCLTEPDTIVAQLVASLEGTMRTFTGFLGIITGRAGLNSARLTFEIPKEPLMAAVRATGFLAMTIGIVFPVRKIFKHKRRLDHEVLHTQSHVAYLTALSEKSRLDGEAAYAEALDGWARDLQMVTEEAKAVRESLTKLEAAETDLHRVLDEVYGRDLIPVELRELSAVCTMVDYLETGQADDINSAAEQYRNDLVEGNVGTVPEQATVAQPTLRALRSSTDRFARELERTQNPDDLRGLVDKHYTDVGRTVDRDTSAMP